MHHNHNRQETVGTHRGEFRLVPERTCEKVEEAIELTEDLVPAQVVMKELGISKKTLRNLIYAGKITRKMFTVAVNGAKFFYNKMILGIQK